jgi:hypothetical protein
MIELYFLFYRVPQIMSRLAKERNRSAVAWSVVGILTWIGAEFLIFFAAGFIYALGADRWDWPELESGGLRFALYIVALVAAIGSFTIVRSVLKSLPKIGELPPPPPPYFGS